MDREIDKIKTGEDVLEYYDLKNWEEIPQEDLWEDGEIREGHSLAIKIYERVIMEGDWKLIRRRNNVSNK